MSGLSWDGTSPYLLDMLRRYLPPRGTLLDVGAGRGRVGWIARFVAPESKRVAVEGWMPHVGALRNGGLYAGVVPGWAPEALYRIDYKSDVAVAADVLEHLTPEAADTTLGRLKEMARVVLVVVPLGTWPQGPLDGNERERHLWSIMPSWLLERGAFELEVLSAANRGRYGLHADLNSWVEAGHIPQALAVAAFRGTG